MIKQFKTIIIDDERPARLRMKELIAEHTATLVVVGEASNGADAIEMIERLKPDLIFLDIQMPNMDGFSMLVKLLHKPMVVFTTAYEQFAIKAFEENAIDYLLKPIEESRFNKCVQKLNKLENVYLPSDFIALKQLFDNLQPKKEITAIPIKIKDKILLVRLNQIAYLEAEHGYVTIHKENGDQQLTDLTLLQLEEKLPSTFLRVQKSYIINTEKINEISKYFNNRLVIVMQDVNKTRITTGTTYINKIRAYLHL